ncbi:MAG: hypothetical protein ABI863_19145 [Ginsengibacter sp.]
MEDKFIHKKIDEVMHSMDGIAKASPRPFLFTRLEARMQTERNIWVKLSSFLVRPVVAFTCICFVLIINAMVIFLVNSPGNSLAQQGNELATADEYSQVSSTLYEFENSKP